jgi:pilus assembly protein CpaB
MRPKTLILFIVAVGCGLVASIGVSQYMEKAKGSGAVVQTAKIFVATTEISPGEKLDAKNISLEEWPKDRIPEGCISDLKELEEKCSRAHMFKGQPILGAMIADTMEGDPARSIKEGFRVVGVQVDEKSSAGGLIRPGDRVDLVLFVRKSADVPETATKTILRDVNVFAVGGKVIREEDKQGGSRDVRNVSLLVTPKQAESVKLASELGTLSLSLRRPGEEDDVVTDGANVSSLLGEDGESANENKNKKKGDKAQETPQWVANPVLPPPPMPVEPPPPPVPPALTMKIRTNNGDHTFVFQEMDAQPQELTDEAPVAPQRSSVAPPASAPTSNPQTAPTTTLPMATPVASQEPPPVEVQEKDPVDPSGQDDTGM